MTSHEHSPVPPFSIGETTDYIATLSQELAALARAQRLDFLAYLLEMAATEAVEHKQGPKPLGRFEKLPKKSHPERLLKNQLLKGIWREVLIKILFLNCFLNQPLHKTNIML